MKIEEMLDDVNLLAPNSFTNERKIGWLNQLIKQLYRDYPLPVRVHEEKSVVGKDKYTLPLDCPPDQLERVHLNGIDLQYDPYGDKGESDTWRINGGNLQIIPIPKSEMYIKLFYKPIPKDYTVADLQAEPDFPNDFHELLVYGLAIQAAKREREFDLVDRLERDYQRLGERAFRSLKGPKKRRITIVRPFI